MDYFESRLSFLLYDHAWDEFRFRRFYPGTDPDELTEIEFENGVDLIPVIIRWEKSILKGDVSMELSNRRSEANLAYREMFGKGAFYRDEDEL